MIYEEKEALRERVDNVKEGAAYPGGLPQATADVLALLHEYDATTNRVEQLSRRAGAIPSIHGTWGTAVALLLFAGLYGQKALDPAFDWLSALGRVLLIAVGVIGFVAYADRQDRRQRQKLGEDLSRDPPFDWMAALGYVLFAAAGIALLLTQV